MLLASASLLYQRRAGGRGGNGPQGAEAAAGLGDAGTCLTGRRCAWRHRGAGRHFQAAAASAPGNGVYANNYGTWLCANGRAAGRLTGSTAHWRIGLSHAGACAGQCRRMCPQGSSVRAEASWRAALALDAVDIRRLRECIPGIHAGHYLEARAFVERWLAVALDDVVVATCDAGRRKTGDNVVASRYRSRLQAISPGPTRHRARNDRESTNW